MKLMVAVLLFAGTAGAGELVGPPIPESRQGHSGGVSLSRTQTDMAWIVGAAALDLGTTEIALRRCETCREGNPLGGTLNARLGLKLGTTAAVSALCYHLHKRGHHKEAKMARWIVVGTWVAASVVNLTRQD